MAASCGALVCSMLSKEVGVTIALVSLCSDCTRGRLMETAAWGRWALVSVCVVLYMLTRFWLSGDKLAPTFWYGAFLG